MTLIYAMTYQIDEIISLCAELGFSCQRVSENEVEVSFEEDGILEFQNMPEENDTLVGFKGTPWHGHDQLCLMTGKSTYIHCDELELLVGLKSGEIVIVSQYMSTNLVDRWLAHRDEEIDLKSIEPGEELRIKRRE